MTESKAYESVRRNSGGFIKFIQSPETPKEYYLDRIKYYVAKIPAPNYENHVKRVYNELLDQIAEGIRDINDDNNTHLKFGDPKTMYIFAYMACYRAWMEAACTDQSYPNTLPAKQNLNQALSLECLHKNSDGSYEINDFPSAFFNKMDEQVFDSLSDPSMKALLASSYYGEYPVIDIDKFNAYIHKSIVAYQEKAENAGHKIKGSKMPNETFHKTIEESFNQYTNKLNSATRSLNFTKQNPLSF